MATSLPSIDLELSNKLKDVDYRRKFFIAESSARIARQLIELRKRRGLSQAQVAELARTGQPAISRAERADYCNWSFNTLRKLAEVMDARIRVLIEPSEEVLREYEAEDFAAAQFIHSWSRNAVNWPKDLPPRVGILTAAAPSAASASTLAGQVSISMPRVTEAQVDQQKKIRLMGEAHGASVG